MKQMHYGFDYEVYDGIDQLAPQDARLLAQARETTQIAYAPYSEFKVGAVAMLANGKEMKGSNRLLHFTRECRLPRLPLVTTTSMEPAITLYLHVAFAGRVCWSTRHILKRPFASSLVVWKGKCTSFRKRACYCL
jgi:hypothetical protein